MLIYGQMDMPEEARREADALVELNRSVYPLVRLAADAYLAYGEKDVERARRLVPECAAHFQEAGISAWEVALFHFYVGEKDKGFEWLERSYSLREGNLMEIKNELTLNSVRNDPRYLDLVKRLGLD
jgi:hypothetical protein